MYSLFFPKVPKEKVKRPFVVFETLINLYLTRSRLSYQTCISNQDKLYSCEYVWDSSYKKWSLYFQSLVRVGLKKLYDVIKYDGSLIRQQLTALYLCILYCYQVSYITNDMQYICLNYIICSSSNILNSTVCSPLEKQTENQYSMPDTGLFINHGIH